MDASALTLIAMAIVAYGLVSARAQRSFVTPAMAFAALGMLSGSAGFGWLRGKPDSVAIDALAELTLVVVLFTDASRIDLKLLWREHRLPVRLLAVGLPLTIVAGTIAAIALFPALSVWEAALLAAIVAPTDASLSHPVVTNKLVPVRVRQTICVESGLNDGLCVPLVLLFLCGARATGHDTDATYWLRFAALQISLGPLVGVLVGGVGGRLLQVAADRHWADASFVDLSALALAGVAYGVAELVGGNGFIAAFCGGLALGHFAPSVCQKVHEFGESEGQLLALLMFLAVGAVMVPLVVDEMTGTALLFALMSLTLLRMIPVAISLLGTGLQPRTVMLIGWFGPRGTASIVFALLVVQDTRVPLRHEIFMVVMTTVLLSVFAHGLSAVPASRWYARRTRATESTKHLAEHVPIHEMPFCCRQSEADRASTSKASPT